MASAFVLLFQSFRYFLLSLTFELFHLRFKRGTLRAFEQVESVKSSEFLLAFVNHDG